MTESIEVISQAVADLNKLNGAQLGSLRKANPRGADMPAERGNFGQDAIDKVNVGQKPTLVDTSSRVYSRAVMNPYIYSNK